MNIAQFIIAHVPGGCERGRIALLGVDVVFITQVFGALFCNSDIIPLAVGSFPLNLEFRPYRNRGRCADSGGAGIFHHWWRRLLDFFHSCKQGTAQRFGTIRRQKQPAGLVSQAAQAPLIFLAQIEADDVHGKIHAAHGQFGGQFAGIEITSFQAVAHQDHRGPLFGIAQRLGGLLDRCAQGGLAFGADGFDLGQHGGRIMGAQRRDHLDIVAIALAAMAVNHQARLHICRYFGNQISHHLLGDVDFGLAVDLAPHGAGCIQHQNHAGGSRSFGRCNSFWRWGD